MRRQQRERREYLYRKSLEDKEKTIHERKQRLRVALQGTLAFALIETPSDQFGRTAGKAIPSDLRGDAAELQRQLQYDDANTTRKPAHPAATLGGPYRLFAEYKDSRDDEYRWAGTQDPKVMVTTSRDPSSRLKQFVKVRLLEQWRKRRDDFTGDCCRRSS